MPTRIFHNAFQKLLGYTLYNTLRSSHDFEDLREILIERTDWSIELFRSCFTIHLTNGNYVFTLCALSFLAIAENIHMHYGRLSPAKLKERVEDMGYVMFALLFALLDIGSVFVRVAGLVALSGSPALAMGLVLISMTPSTVFPLLTYPAKLFKRRHRESSGEADVENGSVGGGIQNRTGIPMQLTMGPYQLHLAFSFS